MGCSVSLRPEATPPLSPSQKFRVGELLAKGTSMAEIAREVGVSYGRVRQVRNGRLRAIAELLASGGLGLSQDAGDGQ